MSVWIFDKLYDYAWFVGFGVAGLVHLILMLLVPPSPARDSAQTG